MPCRRRIQLLYVGDATFARECLARRGGSIEVTSAIQEDGRISAASYLQGGTLRFDLLLIEHGQWGVDALAVLEELRARNLSIPAIVVADWNEELAAHALRLGASDYVVKSTASFRALYFRLHRLIAHAAANHKFSEQAREERDQLRGKLSEAEAARHAAEQRLHDAMEAVKQARQHRLADAVDAAKEHTQRESEFAARIGEARAAARTLEQQLRDQGAILQLSEARVRRSEQIAENAARLQSEFETALREEKTRQQDLTVKLADAGRAGKALEERLLDAEAALGCAEQRVIAAHQAGQQRLNEQQAEFHAELTRQRSTIDTLSNEIVQLKCAIQDAEDRRASDAASAAARYQNLRGQYDDYVAAASISREALQARLDDRERALDQAMRQHASRMAEATRALAESRSEADARLAKAVAATRSVEDRLRQADAERQRDQQQHEADRAAAASELADVRRITEQQLAEAAVGVAALETKLREAEAHRVSIEEQHAAETAQATASLEQQHRQTEMWLTDAAAVANTLEERVADVTAALERVREEATAERDAMHARAQEVQTAFDSRLADEAATREALGERLREVTAEFDAAVEHHAFEINSAAARLTEAEEKSSARLAQAETAIRVAESKRAEAIAALNRVVQQATAERQAAASEAAERHAQFKMELAREVASREAIARELDDTRASAERSVQRYAEDLAAAEQRARAERLEFEQRTAHEHAEWERVALAAAQRIKDLGVELDDAKQSLTQAGDEIQRVSRVLEYERTESERKQHTADRLVAELRSERDTLQQTLDHTRATADEILTRVTQDRSIERARLEATVADLETQLREHAARMQVAEQAAAVRLGDTEQRLNEMRAAKENLEGQLNLLREELATANGRGDVLRATADRVPSLEKDLDTVRAESRRQFDENPASWLRCRRSGEIVHANRAMTRLLGYDGTELQQLDFGATVFDTDNDFQWMIDRCLTSLSTQSMETTWRRKDGRRIIARLIAVPAPADSVDLVAEDVTHVRQLEERLRNSQRMESVARYGSEVAVTCQGLLHHVKNEGQQWLAGIESDTVRYRGELLLDEVTRAEAYLSQLAAYSEEQRSAPDLVDVNKVLRDLEPVLKRVAGENIDVVLPQASAPLNLDVEARPVERMLVNVAAYGRERMPLGGRLKIDVDSVVVDREFVAKHPHVRPGEHVLLIVNEERRVVRPDRPDIAAPPDPSPASANFTGDSPGVDLGALQALVSECGGYLWMRAEPPGDMELKIHLPRRALDRSESVVSAMPPGRSRWIRRAFGSRH